MKDQPEPTPNDKFVDADPAAAASIAERSHVDIKELERRVEKLTLATNAVWELLRETPGFTDEQLTTKMREIDSRDGKMDGKIAPAVLECPSCHKKNTLRRRTCLYCETELQGDQLFR